MTIYKNINQLLLPKLNSKTIVVGSLLLLASLLGIPIWQDYLHRGFLFYTTLLLAPYILYIQQKDVASSRYAWASIAAALGHWYLDINILYLAAYLFFGLFLIEWKSGRLNALSIYWIFMLSPLTVFLFSVFSFPIRLELSQWASWLLQFIYPQLLCQGNIIHLHGVDFSVDKACMGLKMVGYSYLAMLVFISYFEQQQKKQLPKIVVAGILGIGTFCILVANLFRILAIILVQAMPETLAHELIGITSWLFYAVLPTYWLVKFAVYQWATTPPILSPKKLSPFIFWGLTIICLIGLSIGSYKAMTTIPSIPKAIIPKQLHYLKQKTNKDGVIQLTNPEVLIYIKPACAPYRADHNPSICWKGSGYAFSKEAIQNVQGVPVFTAQLTKENQILYTAWWYDNGQHKTTSQFEWRWNSLRGKGQYQLFNVTVQDSNLLKQYIHQAMYPSQ